MHLQLTAVRHGALRFVRGSSRVPVHALIMLWEHSLVQQPLSSTGGGRRSVASGARRLRSGDRRAHRHAV
jgi:hypothetical protein